MRNISKIVALSLLMSFAISQTTGKLRGTVSSADGQPLAGANVIVDGTTKGAATDGEGKYTILNVDAGLYSVTVSYIGYQSNSQSNVEVKVGLTTPLNFSMQTSAIEGEVVTIIGEKRLIEPSATNSVRVVGEQEIRNSASRSVVGVLDLQPGVNITNGRISVRGGRSEEVAYTLDGAAITDVINTGFEFSAIPEALAEISVEAGGYGAHIGGANSGVIRQTLRTGANEVSGDVRFETGDYGMSNLTATVMFLLVTTLKHLLLSVQTIWMTMILRIIRILKLIMAKLCQVLYQGLLLMENLSQLNLIQMAKKV